MEHVQILVETFVHDPTFDYAAYVIKQLATIEVGWQIVVEFQATLYVVRQKIPASYGTFEPTAQGTLFQCGIDDLGLVARYLVSLNLPFVVHRPPELRAALRQLAEQIAQIAHA